MTEKIRTVVRIAGREYPITSYDGEDYVRRVGAYVDRKIGELALATRLSPLEVTTLAAVSIADDLAKSQEEVTRLKTLETSSDAGDLSYFSLAAGRPGRHMDPFIITVDPSGATDHELVGHEGEEWLFGMEGCIEIEYGKDLYVLHPGESIYYDSIVPHQVRAHEGQRAKFLAVVYTPL